MFNERMTRLSKRHHSPRLTHTLKWNSSLHIGMEKYGQHLDTIASASSIPRRESPSSTRKRIIKACTACKQSKVRCDANTTNGKPCSRCTVRGLECEVDAGFKRTPVRERIAAMAAELRQLRQQVRDIDPSPSTEPTEEHYQNLDLTSIAEGSFRSTSEPTVSSRRTTEATISYNPPLVHDGPLSIDTMYIGSTLFSTDEICSCIGIFHEHFHPCLPIVDATTPISALQIASPLLIKTIIVIVCQRLNSAGHGEYDLELLADEFQVELNQAILRGPISIHTVQALILLCNWPLPTTNILAETSWLYCGVAINGAKYLHLGCFPDTPFYYGDDLKKSDFDNMNRTWLALFIISTTFAALIGVPMPFRHFSDLNCVEECIARTAAPANLLVQAAVCLVLAKHSVVVYENTDMSVHERLLRIHSKELDQIHRRYLDTWTEELNSFLSYAKLHLYSILVVRLTKHNETTVLLDPSRPTLPPATLTTCSSLAQQIIITHSHLIGDIEESSLECSNGNMTRASTLTKVYYQRYFCASVFLLRYVCFNHGIPDSDRTDAHRHVLLSIELFRRTARSSRATEEHTRLAELLENLLAQSIALPESQTVIHDRGSASLLWDTFHGSLRHVHQAVWGTGLMELIDPTRHILQLHSTENTARAAELPLSFRSAAPHHALTSMADESEAILWAETPEGLFNMDFGSINDPGGMNTHIAGQP